MSVYIIRCKNLAVQDCYIGSTEDMKRRRGQHKINCNNEKRREYNFKLYQYIRDNGGWNEWEMVEICKCDIDKLRKIEQYHIDTYKSNLNSQRAYTSEEQKIEQHKKCDKEYYEKNKNKMNEHKKIYYQKNKNKINEKRSEQFTCECGSIYTISHKARHLRTTKHKSFVENNNLIC